MKKRTFLSGLAAVLSIISCTNFAPKGEITPGELWPDAQGVHINAHGGGVLVHNGVCYWYGEHKSDTTSSAMVGITCYSSTDLSH